MKNISIEIKVFFFLLFVLYYDAVRGRFFPSSKKPFIPPMILPRYFPLSNTNTTTTSLPTAQVLVVLNPFIFVYSHQRRLFTKIESAASETL
jgi:hypothetical protein